MSSKQGHAARIEVKITVNGREYVDAYYISNDLLRVKTPAQVGDIIQNRMRESSFNLLRTLYDPAIRNPEQAR